MGLLYNNRKKTDIVVLNEEELENSEGKLCDFVILPPENESNNSDSDIVDNKEND